TGPWSDEDLAGRRLLLQSDGRGHDGPTDRLPTGLDPALTDAALGLGVDADGEVGEVDDDDGDGAPLPPEPPQARGPPSTHQVQASALVQDLVVEAAEERCGFHAE